MTEDSNFSYYSSLFNGVLGLEKPEIFAIFLGIAIAVVVSAIIPAYLRILRNVIGYSLDKKRTEIQEAELSAVLELIRKNNQKFHIHSSSKKRAESSGEGGEENEYKSLIISKFRDHLLFDESNYRKKDGSPSDDWRSILIDSIERLSSEADRMRSKSLTNLTLGVVFSTFAVIALILLLFFGPGSSESSVGTQLVEYIPRLTIAALLQIVAIFFLKIYASIENDLKQNKNEITNIELKLASGLALVSGSAMHDIATCWGKEERNFVIEKTQKVASQFDVPQIESLLASLSEFRKDADKK